MSSKTWGIVASEAEECRNRARSEICPATENRGPSSRMVSSAKGLKHRPLIAISLKHSKHQLIHISHNTTSKQTEPMNRNIFHSKTSIQACAGLRLTAGHRLFFYIAVKSIHKIHPKAFNQ